MVSKEQKNKQPKHKHSYKTLRTAIEKSDLQKIQQIFTACPKLITSPQSKEDGLKHACLSGKTASTQLLLQILAKENNPQTDKSINDSIIESIRCDKLDMVKIFVDNGFNLNNAVFKKKDVSFTCIDFAILGGHYDIAYYIYNRIDPRLKNLRNIKEYELLGKKYLYRYVNYQMVVDGLTNKIKPDQIGSYLKKQLSPKRKQEIRRIYHEGCWEWLMRMLGVKNKQKKQETTTVQIDPNPEKVQTDRALTNTNTH